METPLHPPPPPPPPRRALPQKNFEKVVAAVLPHVKVSYVPLPPIPSRYMNNNNKGQNNGSNNDDHHHQEKKHDNGNNADTADDEDDWPFGGLPQAARVFGTLEGQLSNRHRAQRKEDQLRCMLRCIFALLPSSSRQQLGPPPKNVEQDEEGPRPFTIVDFGGGSGHLAIPLALLLQQRQQEQEDSFKATTATTTTTTTTTARRRPFSSRVIVVDLSTRSLDLLHKKASHCGSGTGGADDGSVKHTARVDVAREDVDARLRPCHGIPNLFTFHGPVEEFDDIPFEMGIALHLCGEATDVALRKCWTSNNNNAAVAAPSSLVFCPCCVGKLNAQRKNPYIWQATGTNMPTISYPQSKIFQTYISSKEDWNALAQAADYSSHSRNNNNNNDTSDTTTTTPHESRTHSNAIRRTAKALVETDRLLFLQEQSTTITTTTYETALTRMIPWEATPKNDIIMAWPTKRSSELNTTMSSKSTTSITRQPWMDAKCSECESDIQQTRNLLVANRAKNDSTSSSTAAENHSYATPLGASGVVQDSIYWTAQEEMEIRNQLQDYFFNNHNDDNDDDDDDHHHHAISSSSSSSSSKDDAKNEQPRKIVIFPTGMGRRKRKLVHHVAELLNLAHWCEGRKAGDKTVAVALRRIPPPAPPPLVPQQAKATTTTTTTTS